MLTEIYCDKFVSGGKTRTTIKFQEGLNVIRGSDTGNNSIGKSTFLMIIDFVFGGKDYIEKLKDLNQHVGEHEIFFSFKFDRDYYFCRPTSKCSDTVFECDSNYNKTGKEIKLEDFTAFLKSKYNIQLKDLTFRQIISRFMRAYNRENLNELLPLRAYDNETEKSSISELIKLFDMFGPIAELSKIYDEAVDKKDTFSKAQKYTFLPKITEAQYKENLQKIEALQNEAEQLERRSGNGLLELNAEKAELAAKIKDQITSLKRERGRYYNQLNMYKKDADYEPANYQKDFSELSNYFENVNLKGLEEIENFHQMLSKILDKELKDAKKATWDSINMYNAAIHELEDELTKVTNMDNISSVVLKNYATIDKEIDTLKKTNDYHLEKKELDKDVKEKGAELEQKTTVQIASLTSSINTKMAEFNDYVDLEVTNPPVLIIPSSKSYRFETINDQGTGTKYKDMIILDLAVLYLTQLPVLSHDSLMFANISIERIDRIFDLYNNCNKQVFIAVDKTTMLSKKTEDIISKHTVIELSPNGNELFGRAWNKKQTEAK